VAIDAGRRTRDSARLATMWPTSKGGMHKSDDPWERESRHDRQHSVSPDGFSAGATDRALRRPSHWRRLCNWLFNVLPIVLSLASMLLVLYLLARLTGLR
jgi:hypothetical protein